MWPKTSIALAALLASLAIPATAASDTPTSTEFAWAHRVAVAYWHVPAPPCGTPTLAFEPHLSHYTALATYSRCTITFYVGPVQDWRDTPAAVCHIYVHEFGHLVLGPTYFASTNPADPAHSADPTNIMYGKADQTLAQYDAASRSVGCVSPPPAKRPHWHWG